MSWFQLDPSAIAIRAQNSASLPTLAASTVRGLIGFTIVSVAGFVPWAVFGGWFHRNLGEAGMYAVCAAVFIGLSGILLHKLIIGSGSLSRFYKLFGLVFTAYSFAWIVGYMALRGHLGGVAGLLAGTALMGWMLTRAFEAPRELLKVIAALFILNAAGYFIGGLIEGSLAHMKELSILGTTLTKPARMTLAMLSWGVSYGVGFGAGLGIAFHLCQTQARALIRAEKA